MGFTESNVENFLEHHGIKGMKWGIRRSDRELARARGATVSNESGKKKLPAASNDVMPKGKGASSEDFDKVAAAKAKGRSSGSASLSNNEMRAINERMQLEQTYAKMSARPKNRFQKAGKKFVDDFIDNEVGKLARGDITGTTTWKLGEFIVSQKKGSKVPVATLKKNKGKYTKFLDDQKKAGSPLTGIVINR